jgi:hypothetical protein
VTLVIAISAFLLSVFNTLKQWDRDRVKLRLKATLEEWAGGLGKPTAVFTIQVVNRSNFAVTVSDAGIIFRKPGAPEISFSQTVEKNADTITNRLPIRLELREGITLSSDNDQTYPVLREFDPKRVYVRTAYGKRKKIRIPMLNSAEA